MSPLRLSTSHRVLIVPAFHLARSGHPTVMFRGDVGSARVRFIIVYAESTTGHATCVSAPPTGQVSADHLEHFVPKSYSLRDVPSPQPPTSMLIMTMLPAYKSTVLSSAPTTLVLDAI